jgi:CRISPR-associated endonuclease/helicase Cas3
MMKKELIANTSGQSLISHSCGVGILAKKLVELISNNSKLADVAFVAGCTHDFGKADSAFQNWVKKEFKKKIRDFVPEEGEHIEARGKFSFENYPRHNEISLLLSWLMLDRSCKSLNKKNKTRLFHAIYWSHAKPIRKEEIKNLSTVYKKFSKGSSDNIKDLISYISEMIESIDSLNGSISSDYMKIKDIFGNEDIKELIEELNDEKMPEYKKYHESNDEIDEFQKNILDNSQNNIVRSAVISADRLISSLSAKHLESMISDNTFDSFLNDKLGFESNLQDHINTCISGFAKKYPDSDRNKKQDIASSDLISDDISILSGAAGVGKTKIALEWATKTYAKKIFWICPRVTVCQSIFNDLIQDDYLPNAKIELNTGEFQISSQGGVKFDTIEIFSGDIVITTIDQFISSIITHRDITKFVDLMCAHIVFDEFHEYINMSAFNLLFAELIQAKNNSNNTNTLLVSATPNYYFVEKFLNIDLDNIVCVESFNKSQYQLDFKTFDEDGPDHKNPFFNEQTKGNINISNTAEKAQNSFIDNHTSGENSLLYHSKYTKQDKQDVFDKMIDSFKENGSRKFHSLRSGPGISAALNITCERMMSEFNNAENTLQRGGRLGRFGENSSVNKMTIVIPESITKGKKNGLCAKFLSHQDILESTIKWHEFLRVNVYGKKLTLKEIYAFYAEFYKDASNVEAVEKDFIKSLKKSVEIINMNVIDPVCIFKGKKKSGKIKIKKNSLRGDNRFVQMSICNVTDRFSRDGVEYVNEYAYHEDSIDSGMTLPYKKITGYGESKMNLLSFMVGKHHNIKEDYLKPYNDHQTIKKARDPEFPIYVSYTPEDLEKVRSSGHPFAVYYVQTERQVIGAMGINKLQGN